MAQRRPAHAGRARGRGRGLGGGDGGPAAPTTPPAEGAVGSGTGMSCFDFKGGIGTASRVVSAGRPHRRRPADDQLRLPRGVHRERRTARTSGRWLDSRPTRSRRRGLEPGAEPEAGPAKARRARASGSWSPTRPSTARRAPGSRAASGSGSPAPARWPTTAAARSSWRSAPGCGSTATASPTARPVVTGRALDPLFAAVVEASEEAVLNSMFTAPTVVGRDGNTSETIHTAEIDAGTGLDRLDRRRPTHEGRGGPDPGPRREPPGRDALPARRRRAGPQPCLLEALPYRKDDLTSSYAASYRTLCEEHGYAVCRIDVRGTGSSPGDPLDEYQEAEQTRPARRDRLARRAGVVRRPGRDVGHVVLRLQLPPDRLRAAAGAEGDLRDLRHRRPLDRRRALAWRRAAAGRPRRLRPLHDADVRAAAGAGGLGRGLVRRVAAAAGDLRAVGADLAAGEPPRSLLGPRVGAARRHDRGATSGSGAR